MLKDVLIKYHENSMQDEHHRYKSWEHCNNFFLQNQMNLDDPYIFDVACLHLAFYLASWGMLRGGSNLLQKDYLIHKYFIERVAKNEKYKKNFKYYEDGCLRDDYFEGIESLIESTENAYIENINVVNGEKKNINVSDTLSSKILLGVYGCMPAYDRYLKIGLKLHGIRTTYGRSSFEELRMFYNRNIDKFSSCYEIFKADGVSYTPMKLIDMYFWQVGYMFDKGTIDDSWIEFATDYKKNWQNAKVKIEINNTGEKPKRILGWTDTARELIIEKLNSAQENGSEYLDIRAGNIQKELEFKNRIVCVCNAMKSINAFEYEVISQPPSGYSTTVVYRYIL